MSAKVQTVDKTHTWLRPCLAIAGLATVLAMVLPPAYAQSKEPARPSLTVSTVPVAQYKVRDTLNAQGNVVAWQELVQGAQLAGVRLLSLHAEVGQVVQKGQVLARFDDEAVRADVAQAQAALAEAQARLTEARQHADMLRKVADPLAVSALELNTALAAETSAQARVQSAKASLAQQQLRLKYTVVRASDHGVVSNRRATVGQVANPGEELFRLVRQQRVEWQPELTAKDLPKVKLGATVQVWLDPSAQPQQTSAQQNSVQGRVRSIAPVLDPQNRDAKVFVELPKGYAQGLRPGMYLRGSIALGERNAMLVPQSAVVQRDGFAYVFVLDPKTLRVRQVKVSPGALQPQGLEILPAVQATAAATAPAATAISAAPTAGLQVGQQVVKTGAAFLADNDLVKVVP